MAAFTGIAIEFLVFRWLRRANGVTKVIASVGLNIALFGLAYMQFGLDNRNAKPILPSGVVIFTSISTLLGAEAT